MPRAQLSLKFPPRPRQKRRGRKRAEFGRTPHRARQVHNGRHPVHVTLRARQGLPSFRQQVIHALILRIFNAQQKRAYGGAFQVVHFSIQSNHIHMIVEAEGGPTPLAGTRRKNPLRSGVSGFLIAFARKLNRLLHRQGRVWDDRYHRHDLATPSEVKRGLRYVINNARKHGVVHIGYGAFDLYSSAQDFDGWVEPLLDYVQEPEPWSKRTPRTWLLAKGWKRCGLLRLDETPGARRA
jgi:REP element-mobilizing transposase RayT